jgi:hypothetical protein
MNESTCRWERRADRCDRLASHRILGRRRQVAVRSTDGGHVSHTESAQECAALPGAQKTMANAVEISTGGAPHFMILEQEG